jgi:hypothetical protein
LLFCLLAAQSSSCSTVLHLPVLCADAAGKCSALIKVSADLSDIFFGHSTWDSFTAMTRIYKHYQLNLQQVPGGVAAQQLSFSSYPGELFR